MVRISILYAFAAIACGSQPNASFHLQVGSSASIVSDGGVPSLELETEQTRTLELFVIGSVSGPVSFTATDLPGFATLNGPFLTLSPTRKDVGQHDLRLTASDGRYSQTSPVQVVVHRSNTPPHYSLLWLGDDEGDRNPTFCPGSMCTVDGTAVAVLALEDADGDGVTVEFEVVPRGAPFSQVATHSLSVRMEGSYARVRVPLSGLTLEQSYQFAVRVTDELGAFAPPSWGPKQANGWAERGYWLFDQGPCTTRQCACMAAPGGLCYNNADCCSGNCVAIDASWGMFRCQ